MEVTIENRTNFSLWQKLPTVSQKTANVTLSCKPKTSNVTLSLSSCFLRATFSTGNAMRQHKDALWIDSILCEKIALKRKLFLNKATSPGYTTSVFYS